MTVYRDTAEAEQALTAWAAAYARRDEIIRAALAAGVTKHRVHVLTGIARTTVDRIAAGQPCDEDAPT
jgi:hypothetical protein